MGKKTKVCCTLVALFAVAHGYGSADAAARQANQPVEETQEKAKAPQAPVVFEGDDVSFDEATGAVYAKGNVKITQNTARLTADDMRGNTRTQELWIDGRAHMTQQDKPQLDLNGDETYYRYQAREGTMEQISGRADERYVKGEKLEFYPDEIIIYNGTMTKCPAKKPDYHMSARKIEVWPNNKMIAYDAKFWIRDKVVYATSRYETAIGDNKKENSVFPSVGYNSDDGFYIKQRLEYPLSNTVYAFTNLGYYTKHDFKNEYGATYHQPNYSFTAETGDYQDDNDNWITKEPNFRLALPNKKIGGTPYSYRFDAEYGKWSDDYKTSWHQDYELYFSRDPIKLSNSLNLYLGAGYEIIKESYDSSMIDTLKYDATLHKTLSPKLSVWTGYHYTKNDVTVALFDYDAASVGKELASGVSYRFDKKNAFTVSHSYDLENSRTADTYYTWSRDLHCWQMALTYHQDRLEKENKWQWKVNVTHW